jgi:hypothetical protein
VENKERKEKEKKKQKGKKEWRNKKMYVVENTLMRRCNLL